MPEHDVFWITGVAWVILTCGFSSVLFFTWIWRGMKEMDYSAKRMREEKKLEEAYGSSNRR